MIIGLTGGIATGKSTAARILEDLGARVIDADKIAHEIMEKGEPGYRQVVGHFGEQILTKDCEIDRRRLGETVFDDPQERRKLEELTHPLIIREIKERIERASAEVIIIEAPLLYEAGLDDFMDRVWVVACDRETQIERLQERDGLAAREAEKRIEAQMPLEEKCRRADRVIENNGDIEDLKENIFFVWQQTIIEKD